MKYTPTTIWEKRSSPITLSNFGLFPLRAPLLGESFLLYIPAGTEMFHFPACLPVTYVFSHKWQTLVCRVAPFRNLRIKGCWHLPKLIAVYHVFHQPPTPEHPPYTLSNLATIFLVASDKPSSGKHQVIKVFWIHLFEFRLSSESNGSVCCSINC